MRRVVIQGHCPECGRRSLAIEVGVTRGPTPRVRCCFPDCSRPDAAAEILDDPEIHHIIRIDERGFFNAQHPLRERVDGQLLDCAVHESVTRWLDAKSWAEHKALEGTTWRYRETAAGDDFERLA